jgi:DNA-binding NtrC family response regulator
VTIELPKLVDRFEDLPHLAGEFVRQFASRRGRAGVRLSNEAVDALSGYDFPGNVRELRNIIEHAVLTTNDDVIDVSGLPEYLRSAARLMQSRKAKPSSRSWKQFTSVRCWSTHVGIRPARRRYWALAARIYTKRFGGIQLAS